LLLSKYNLFDYARIVCFACEWSGANMSNGLNDLMMQKKMRVFFFKI